MPYPINRRNGSLIANLPDYTKDNTSTSLTLMGRGIVDYGEIVAENFVHVLENFANPTPPENPIEGQLWFQTTGIDPDTNRTITVNKVKVYNGLKWVSVGAASNGVEPPSAPEKGDMWYDPVTNRIYYWDGIRWVEIGKPFTGSERPNDPPANPSDGSLWFMLPEGQLWSYDSKAGSCIPHDAKRSNGDIVPPKWTLVGPMAPRIVGTTEDAPEVGSESETYHSYEHVVEGGQDVHLIKVWQGGKLMAVWSSNYVTTKANVPDNFMSFDTKLGKLAKLRPGLNLNMNLTFGADGKGYDVMNGIAAAAETLYTPTGEVLDTSALLRKDRTDWPTKTDVDIGRDGNRFNNFWVGDVFAGASNTKNDDITRVNLHGKAAAAVDADTAKKFKTPIDLVTGGDLEGAFRGVDGSKNVTANIAFSTAGIKKIKDLVLEGAQEVIDAKPMNFVKTDGPSLPTGQHNVGSAAQRFGTIFAVTFDGTATSAKYADLAERYEADAPYAPGTVVKIGGDKEITQTTSHMDFDVFGVISEKPAYLMNSTAGDDVTHPPVAQVGRVNVRVVGPVKKGQRLVSGPVPGTAVALSICSGNETLAIIGRALESKETQGEGLVLAAVAVK